MRLRNQRGCLRCTRRKTGPSCWEFLWRENDSDGNRPRRTAVIGTLEQFPTRELAQAAVNGLRMSINQDRNRQREQSIVVADLVDHYIHAELSDEADWHSHATQLVYREFLKRWIRLHWGHVGIRDVRTVAVERWLKQLRRVNGERLADATKAKIRNLMSVLFNHAIRYEWLEQGTNPITLVRQSAQRKWTPEILEPHEIHNLLLQLNSCFRLMVLLDVTTGLRRSELLALKWSDVDFSSLELNVVRSIYLRIVGNCKTEASRKPVPLDAHVAADLWLWKRASIPTPTIGYSPARTRRANTRFGRISCC
jgi:integrase